MWKVLLLPEFSAWLDQQTQQAKAKIVGELLCLRRVGPALGRPKVDSLKGSKLAHLKELRVQVGGAPYRVFFAFDPTRQAIVLCGGDKTGDKRFYKRMIPLAESLFARHLGDLETTNQDEEGHSP